MRKTIAHLFALAGIFTFGLVLVCGAGRGEAAPPDTSSSVECENGTVASYVGTTCSLPPAVLEWSSYTCTSTPSSICAALGRNGSNIEIRRDPKGPHTLLVGETDRWNVTAGQSVDVVIRGSVSGASANLNWPHFNRRRGQTGDGTEENITTVSCSGDCLSGEGVSDVRCSATSPEEYCTDQGRVAPYMPATARFNPATSDRPYPFTVEVKLNGGTSGTATLHSVGIHLGAEGGGRSPRRGNRP